jgi:hypothetical protein
MKRPMARKRQLDRNKQNHKKELLKEIWNGSRETFNDSIFIGKLLKGKMFESIHTSYQKKYKHKKTKEDGLKASDERKIKDFDKEEFESAFTPKKTTKFDPDKIAVWKIQAIKSVIVFSWIAEEIGFGEVIVNKYSYEIIDDEDMPEEFVNIVISKGLDAKLDFQNNTQKGEVLMSKMQYFILLSDKGDFLRIDVNGFWQATFYFDDATLFETHEEATSYLNEMDIQSIWPMAKVENILL